MSSSVSGLRISSSVRVASVLAALGLSLYGAADGRDPVYAADARQIVDDVERRSTSKSQRYEGVLQTIDDGRPTAEKRWRFERLGSHGDSRSTIRFTAPAEVRGVALLVVNHPDRASDQWMWTPALERDRRIALQDRSTRFFGTDFSFEDLEERDADQYEFSLLPDRAIDKADCWVIDARAKQTKSSQYSRQIVWVRKDIVAVARIESFVESEMVRRLEYADFQQIQGIWTARELRMTDLRRRSTTRLALEKIEYQVPLKDSDFTLEAIRR